jgi:hypothetical protein
MKNNSSKLQPHLIGPWLYGNAVVGQERSVLYRLVVHATDSDVGRDDFVG